MLTAISTDETATPIGPYSKAIQANGLVFVSGQVGIDPATRELVEGGIGPQTERTLKNLEAVLRAAGSGLDRVVRCSVFLTSMKDFGTMNEIYGGFFTSPHPARTTVEVSKLPKDALVEIDAIATSSSR
jgi:2-iminobutanoate/2-iminopropanoate deaminase